ncbi:S4 domain-containing protein YaaA [Lactobacillus sp. UCMA15818]|uniref:S4 domain-containing protein YaaA n=1 Tax=Lactobacillaceae TaxID=33958 RepID=UPI0025B0EA39|nr:S4 domain-containing protein YaaA [Lactobacillus sp. UCMA15818]MDN2453227.1 S4 domain-containing protein YaaA [Lactobacillus sp. UCMA15818]
MDNEILLKTEYITLGQMLKIAAIIDSGGQAKWFLQENEVWVNGEQDNRRGRKLYAGDQVNIPTIGKFLMRSKQAR